ncbi:MAG: hypothetical protein NVS3B1_02040 [Marmoricola sp.]
MHQETSTTDLLRQSRDTRDDVYEQCRSQTAPLVIEIDSQSSEQGDWLRIPTSSLSQPRWCADYRKMGHRPGEVPNNPRRSTFSDDEDLGGSCRSRLPSVIAEPIRLLR